MLLVARWSGIKIIRHLEFIALRIFQATREEVHRPDQYGAQVCATDCFAGDLSWAAHQVEGHGLGRVHIDVHRTRAILRWARGQRLLRSDAALSWKPCVASGRLTAIPRCCSSSGRPPNSSCDRQCTIGCQRRAGGLNTARWKCGIEKRLTVPTSLRQS